MSYSSPDKDGFVTVLKKDNRSRAAREAAEEEQVFARLKKHCPNEDISAMTFEDAKRYLDQVLAEKAKREAPKPAKKAEKKDARPAPVRERYGKVTTSEKAVDAVTRIVKNTLTGKISFADFGTRFQDLTGSTWHDSARLNLGSIRSFILSRPEFVVTDSGHIALANSAAATATPTAAAPASVPAPAAPAAAPAAQRSGKASSKAHGHGHSHGNGAACSRSHSGDYDAHDEEEMRRNARGCAPAGSESSGLSTALAGASALVFTLLALALVLHLDLVPGAGAHPALAPYKTAIDGFIAELLR